MGTARGEPLGWHVRGGAATLTDTCPIRKAVVEFFLENCEIGFLTGARICEIPNSANLWYPLP